MLKLIGIMLLLCAAAGTQAAKSNSNAVRPAAAPWVKIYQDEYGKTYAARYTGAAAVASVYPQAKRFGYKYVYTYGVPNLKIQPKGYIQAVHLIDCAEQTRAYETSQRFKPNGAAIDLDGTMPVYFEPMDLQVPEVEALYRYICKEAS